MLNVMASTAKSKNPGLVSSTRNEDEDNVDWLERQLRLTEMRREVSAESAPSDANRAIDRKPTYIILFGGCDRAAFRLRLAQAHLRDDLWPSHWSHAALLGSPQEEFSKTELFEVSLQPRLGFESAIESNNGLQTSAISRYSRAQVYPNICILKLEVPMVAWLQQRDEQVASILEMFTRQRAVLDAPELVLVWLAFLWGVGRTPNPLFEGHGVPSAAMIDAILSAVGFDISPSIDSRLSSPESFWQAAKWWHEFYKGKQAVPINGRYHIHNRIDQGLLKMQTSRQRIPT
jgi:hypothetical protein